MFHLSLSGVLPPTLCDELVTGACARGFEPAAVNHYGEQKRMTNVRNNERLEWCNPEWALKLERLLQDASGEAFPYRIGNRSFVAAGEHLRMYRYRPGQYFKPHRDGHVRNRGLESLVTVLLYLTDAAGGETLLMPTSYSYRDDWIRIRPRTGDALMFEHDFWHEGRPVTSGDKYVLRTDLFYK